MDLKPRSYPYTQVCLDHFIYIFKKPADLYDVSNPDWVLSKDLGYGVRLYLVSNSFFLSIRLIVCM